MRRTHTRLLWLLAIVVIGAVVLPHAGALTSSTQRPDDIQAKLAKLKAQLADSHGSRAKLMATLKATDDTLNELEGRLRDAQFGELAAEARRTQAASALADANAQVARLRPVVELQARHSYVSGAPASIGALVASKDPTALLDQV